MTGLSPANHEIGNPPFRDCVVIVMEGRYGRNRQSGSSALECGHLELWVIELLANATFSWACNTVADR
jgi:hypothetical protein